jgi:hypothetical protein
MIIKTLHIYSILIFRNIYLNKKHQFLKKEKLNKNKMSLKLVCCTIECQSNLENIYLRQNNAIKLNDELDQKLKLSEKNVSKLSEENKAYIEILKTLQNGKILK